MPEEQKPQGTPESKPTPSPSNPPAIPNAAPAGTKQDDVDKLMKDLGIAPGQGPAAPTSSAPAGQPQKAAFERFDTAAPTKGQANIEMLKDIDLKVKVELGRAGMYVQDVLKLSPGSIVELDKLTGDPLDLYVNDRLVARGEVLVINENFAIRITEVIKPGSEGDKK